MNAGASLVSNHGSAMVVNLAAACLSQAQALNCFKSSEQIRFPAFELLLADAAALHGVGGPSSPGYQNMKMRSSFALSLTVALVLSSPSLRAEPITIEAEDYNFNGGEFIDNPPPSGINNEQFPVNYGEGYFDRIGVKNIDYFDTQESLGSQQNHAYRLNDFVGTHSSTDTLRSKYQVHGLDEIEVFLLRTNEWLNYTRTFPATNYTISLRAASAQPQQVDLHLVTSSRSETDQTSIFIGSFQLSDSMDAFTDVSLLDRGTASPIVLQLEGIQTLRLLAAGANDDLRLNYFELTPTSEPPTLIGPTLTAITPVPGAQDIDPDTVIQGRIDDRLTQLQLSSLQIFLDNTNVTATTEIFAAPPSTLFTYTPPTAFERGSEHTVTVSFQDTDGNPFQFEWSFKVTSGDLGPLTITREGSQIVVRWPGSGTLQQAETLTGTWSTLEEASSPYSIPAPSGQQFFRLVE